MKTLKTLSVKTFALTAIIALAAGCASVTDATFEDQPASTALEQTEQPADDTFGADDDMQPIYDKPTMDD